MVEDVHLISKFDERLISACMIKEKFENLQRTALESNRRGILGNQEVFELVLSTRLTDDHFRSMIIFVKAMLVETPIEEIQKALVS